MPKHRILLVEELVLSDSAEFLVESDTPADAATLLIKARQAGLDEDTDTVRLPDGQAHEISPQDVVRSRLFCVLLDEDGNQIEEIEPADPALRTKRAPQPPSLGASSEDHRDPQWLYDADNWDATYSWTDRDTLAEAVDLSLGEFRAFATLINGPPVYAARVPMTFDDDGYPDDTEIRWFRGKGETQIALALAWGKSPNPDYAAPTISPWGAINAMRFIAPGIFEVSTPSHGGIKLSPTLNADMPHYMRSADAWYEEDCKWSLVALKYPAPFQAEIGLDPSRPSKTAYELALECARHWYPEIVARFLNDDKSGQDAGAPAAPPAEQKNQQTTALLTQHR